MKEISPKELQKINDKSFKNTQKVFRRRLREIAAGGENKAKYKPDDYCCGDRIEGWLKSLGFTVKQVNPIWCEVTWPEERKICRIYFGLSPEPHKILNSTLPDEARRAIDGLKVKQEELGTWKFDPHPYDYVCSACGKHSEYKTDFCCNCGKKMKPMDG